MDLEPISLIFSPDFPDESVAGSIVLLDPKDSTGPTAKNVWRIGKASFCDVRIGVGNSFISRLHATIILKEGEYRLIDGGIYEKDTIYNPSKNGVWKNKSRLTEEESVEIKGVSIEPGDKITLGIPAAKILVALGNNPTLNQSVWDQEGWADFIPKQQTYLSSEIHQQLVDAAKPPQQASIPTIVLDVVNYFQEQPKTVWEALWKILQLATIVVFAVVSIKYILPLFPR